MKQLPAVILGIVMVLSGIWAAQALYDWEWTRALWMSVAFVAAEVGLVGVMVLRRLKSLSEQLDGRDGAPDPVRLRLAETRPATDRFAWLEEATSGMGVFVTMIVGGGILVSGVLWLVDKIAGRTIAGSRERRLAGELGAIALPPDGLVPAESTLFAADLAHDERHDLTLLLTGRVPHVHAPERRAPPAEARGAGRGVERGAG